MGGAGLEYIRKACSLVSTPNPTSPTPCSAGLLLPHVCTPPVCSLSLPRRTCTSPFPPSNLVPLLSIPPACSIFSLLSTVVSLLFSPFSLLRHTSTCLYLIHLLLHNPRVIGIPQSYYILFHSSATSVPISHANLSISHYYSAFIPSSHSYFALVLYPHPPFSPPSPSPRLSFLHPALFLNFNVHFFLQSHSQSGFFSHSFPFPVLPELSFFLDLTRATQAPPFSCYFSSSVSLPAIRCSVFVLLSQHLQVL